MHPPRPKTDCEKAKKTQAKTVAKSRTAKQKHKKGDLAFVFGIMARRRRLYLIKNKNFWRRRRACQNTPRAFFCSFLLWSVRLFCSVFCAVFFFVF